MENKTKDLYNPKDVQKVRDILIEEQDGMCKITGLELPPKQACLDHAHDSNQYVRGVAHRQANAALGKVENIFTRYLSWWYPDDLPTFLRQCASYIEQEPDTRYRHPGWLKFIQSRFNALPEASKERVLNRMNTTGKNGSQRKLAFRKALLTREFDYVTVKGWIESETPILPVGDTDESKDR